MNRFAVRSNQSELIDQPDIPFADWETCLNELNMVNTWLGGHAITVEGVKKLLRHSNTRNPVTIAEIGCGGGDNLKAIARWNNGRLPIRYIGIDINSACTTFASKNCSSIGDVQFICADYRNVVFESHKPDITFNSLFCHHFSNDQLVELLVWMKENSRQGFFINDLQRHPVAYHSISLLTAAFSRSYLVKNDGPISVLRGFRKPEWEHLFRLSGINDYTISWRWAFRYLITVPNA